MDRGKRYTIDLPRHMAQCDANYLRLCKLFPRMSDSAEQTFAVSLASRLVQVRLEVIERSPYTTLIGLQQVAEDDWATDLTMRIRLYHDARSAEVVEFQNQRRFAAVYDYPNKRMRQRDEKAQVNRFLGELLSHCLASGVSVAPALTTS